MPRWLVVLLLLFVVFCLLSLAAFLCLPLILQGFMPKVGTVLVYEMEEVKPRVDAALLAEKTVAAINLRLKSLPWSLGEARLIEGNRIEVDVYGNDPSNLEKVADSIQFSGTLEFRIVANMHKHKEAIEIAKNESKKMVYYDSKGEWSARWIPVNKNERFNPQENLVRSKTIKGQEFSELLVVRDIYDVTGDFLANARPSSDESGKPAVFFTFNSKGVMLFGELTGDNVPGGNPEFKNQLGIILNGVLYSAPYILTTISDQGQITGNFTQQEVDQIVSCLNAGSLPVNLRKVEERRVETK